MAWLKVLTLSSLKQHPSEMSLVMKRKSCGLHWSVMLQVHGIKGTYGAIDVAFHASPWNQRFEWTQQHGGEF
jgi:hypothetical protein